MIKNEMGSCMLTFVHVRIADSCHKKCISTNYDQADLSQGEAVCIDRCVAKFIDVNTKVGEKMQQMGGQ